jgi:hypothetical protein
LSVDVEAHLGAVIHSDHVIVFAGLDGARAADDRHAAVAVARFARRNAEAENAAVVA